MSINKGLFTSMTPNWATPKAVYEELDSEFNFDFDPYPFKGFKLQTLRSDKWGKSNFVNPPYGPEIAKALARCISHRERAVFLIPARTDTKWFHDLVLPKAKEIRFVRGRIHFNEKGPAPFPSMIVVFEPPPLED